MRYFFFLVLVACFYIGYSVYSGQAVEVYRNKASLQELNKDSLKYDTSSTILSLQDLKLKDEYSDYNLTRASVEKKRGQLSQEDIPLDSVAKAFQEALVNRLIPYWDKTPWSFEGHTAKPTEGTIACGYFVSTTLQHSGLNLNRYKLAQQSPINEAKSLAEGIKPIIIEEGSKAENIQKIREILPPGIHFIGFDQSHVGYVLKENSDLYLIHSNYIEAVGVSIERIEDSRVFESYGKYYPTELSTNSGLLRKWLTGEEIDISTD